MRTTLIIAVAFTVAPIFGGGLDKDLAPVVEKWPHTKECVDSALAGDLIDAGVCANQVYFDYGDAGALYLKAFFALRKKDFKEAHKWADKAIGKEPSNHLVQGLKGKIYTRELQGVRNQMKKFGLSKKAVAHYQKALKLAPEVGAYRWYVYNYKLQAPGMAGGSKQEAFELADAGVDLGTPGAHFYRGRALMAMKKMEKAMPDMLKAKEQGTWHEPSFNKAAYWALEKKQFDLAETFFNYIVERAPEDPNSYDCLGDYYLARNMKDQARDAFGKALEKDPNFGPSKEKYAALR